MWNILPTQNIMNTAFQVENDNSDLNSRLHTSFAYKTNNDWTIRIANFTILVIT